MDWTKDINEGMGLVDRAVAFAAVKHAGQFRKGTTIPYITHWIPVVSVAEANLLNILLDYAEFDKYPVRHLCSYNSSYIWAGEDKPKARDVKDLKARIRKKYPLNGIEELIREATDD